MNAVERSFPPKQRFVVRMSSVATCRCSPLGEKIVMPPVRLGANGNGGNRDDPNEANGDDRNQDQNENEDQGEDRD